MDMVHQSIASMALMPPHSPVNPQRYSSFFNDSKTLASVAPYKLDKEKHPKDGREVYKLEYNNFYSDWKQDALKWYPRGVKEFEFEQQIKNGNDNGNGNGQVPLPQDEAMTLYEQTRRRDKFAVPLPTDGTNQIGILFNDKCNIPTFQFKRYAAQPVNNSEWFNNKLYIEDISKETQEQNMKYMNSIEQNNMNLYSSVFEDMYILQSRPSIGDNMNYIRKTY
jgi:hypothetical protein